MLQPLARATWAPIGETPILPQWERRDRLTGIAAVALDPCGGDLDLYFQLLPRNARFHDFICFLRELRDELRRDLIVVWDRLAAHRKADGLLTELDCDWVHMEYLPPYCPDLNPVEHVWSTTKWNHRPNWPPDDITAVYDGVEHSLTNQATDEYLLESHFDWAGLDLSDIRS